MNDTIWNICKNRSYVSEERIKQIHFYLIESIKTTPENYNLAEIGVLKGGTSKYIAKVVPDRQLYIFDTFKGLPKNFISPIDGDFTEETFSDTHIDEVSRYLSDCKNITIKEGDVPFTFNELKNKYFSFVFIDCFLYYSIYSSLLFFSKRINNNSNIIVDDYGRKECPGVKIAVEKFIKEEKIFSLDILEDYMVLIKKK